jgi:hypothetical protein
VKEGPEVVLSLASPLSDAPCEEVFTTIGPPCSLLRISANSSNALSSAIHFSTPPFVSMNFINSDSCGESRRLNRIKRLSLLSAELALSCTEFILDAADSTVRDVCKMRANCISLCRSPKVVM